MVAGVVLIVCGYGKSESLALGLAIVLGVIIAGTVFAGYLAERRYGRVRVASEGADRPSEGAELVGALLNLESQEHAVDASHT
jgi:hypothetical protein